MSGFQNGYQRRYTEEDAAIVDEAKRIHRETTKSAQNALKTAERTKELASNTLEELNRQGQNLDRVDRDLHEIDADVTESKNIISYMQRCCLLFLCSCCCDCDPHSDVDKNRKQRVKDRNTARKSEVEIYKRADERRQEVPPALKTPVNEESARNELFARSGETSRRTTNNSSEAGFKVGQDLEEPDQRELQKETDIQERALDKIGEALGDLRRMGAEMTEELEAQDVKIENLQNHVDKTHTDLTDVSATAKKAFKLKTKDTQTKYLPSKSGVLKGIAKHL